MTRRELLRRGAVVGGALVWVAPAIQSVKVPAFASTLGRSPGTCAACYCWNGTLDKSEITGDFCTDDGTLGLQENRDTCRQWCQHQGDFTVVGAPGGPFQHSEYCSGTTSCRCSSANDADPGLAGVACT